MAQVSQAQAYQWTQLPRRKHSLGHPDGDRRGAARSRVEDQTPGSLRVRWTRGASGAGYGPWRRHLVPWRSPRSPLPCLGFRDTCCRDVWVRSGSGSFRAPEGCKSWGTGQQESRALGRETGRGAGGGTASSQRSRHGRRSTRRRLACRPRPGSFPRGPGWRPPSCCAGEWHLSFLVFGDSLAECWRQQHTDRRRFCLQGHSQVEPDDSCVRRYESRRVLWEGQVGAEKADSARTCGLSAQRAEGATSGQEFGGPEAGA